MNTVVNLQRKRTLEITTFRDFADRLVDVLPEARGKTLSVAFIGDSRMSQLNHTFRGKTGTTDVLSFPHEPDSFDPDQQNLGDIVISVEQAVRQAAENDLELDLEIKQLMLHGALHLCGYDHETDDGEMDRYELEMRGRLDIQ